MVAIVYMWHLFHRGRVDAHKLIGASALYVVFALGVALWLF